MKRCMTLALWYKILNIQSSGHARQPHRIRPAASVVSPYSPAFASILFMRRAQIWLACPLLQSSIRGKAIDQGKASAYYDSASSHLASRSYLFLEFMLHIQRTVIEVTSAQLIKSRWQAWGIKVRRA